MSEILIYNSVDVKKSRDSSWQELLEEKRYFWNAVNETLRVEVYESFENARDMKSNWEKKLSEHLMELKDAPKIIQEKIMALE
ncbi:MAG: hypothetical protein ACLGHN_08925 [Bacteriovoracia bacterium]